MHTNHSFHSEPLDEIVKKLDSSKKRGLTRQHVVALQKRYGNNELTEKAKDPWWKKLLTQFNNYLVWILIVGAVIAIFADDLVDGILILIIIVFMAVLGYIQDAKAEEALKNLKKLEAHFTTVIRDGETSVVDTKEVVPGDIIQLKAGDAVPADLRIIDAQNCSINESTLTGESLPSTKHAGELAARTPMAERKNMAYAGTLVLQGKLMGIVVTTAMHTELGNIASLLESTLPEPTPLEQQLEKLGKFLSALLIALVVLVMILNVVVRGQNFLDALLESVALAIAAVPEGMPAVITICLAFGTQAMVKKQALVRKLKAVEALGSVSVIFTDKTGTLTTGTMSVTHVWPATTGSDSKESTEMSVVEERMLRVAKLCNSNSNPTDVALALWTNTSGKTIADLRRVHEYEFTSTLKRMTTIHRLDQLEDGSTLFDQHEVAHSKTGHHAYLVATKGAPEIILAHSTRYRTHENKKVPLTHAMRESIEAELLHMTSKGLRVLAIAEKKLDHFAASAPRSTVEDDLVFLGLVGLSDPSKPEVPAAIAATRMAGIRPIMMTGDNPITARTIATTIGLLSSEEAEQTGAVMTGEELDLAFQQGKTAEIMRVSVFARVSPSHKSMLVDTFQSAGYLVAMVGDGVNDAPSIKAAHVGVAMGLRGSDVTKSAADLVLMDDDYETLVDAIAEGRNILHRIRLFVGYLLSCNFAEIGIFVTATIIGVPAPLSAVMLLLLNVVTDAAPAVAMSREPGEPDLMLEPPRKASDPIITRHMWLNIGYMTIIATVAVMISYCIGLKYSLETGRTMAFVTLSALELLRGFSARSYTKNIWQVGLKNNHWMIGAVLFGLAVTLAVVFFGKAIFETAPLTLELLLIAALFSIAGPVAEELGKPLINRLAGTK